MFSMYHLDLKIRNNSDNQVQSFIWKYFNSTSLNTSMEADIFLWACKKAAALDLNIASRKMVKNLCTMFMNNLHIKKIYFLSFLWLHECSVVQSATPSLTCEQNATVTRSPVPGKSDYNRLKTMESVLPKNYTLFAHNPLTMCIFSGISCRSDQQGWLWIYLCNSCISFLDTNNWFIGKPETSICKELSFVN